MVHPAYARFLVFLLCVLACAVAAQAEMITATPAPGTDRSSTSSLPPLEGTPIEPSDPGAFLHRAPASGDSPIILPDAYAVAAGDTLTVSAMNGLLVNDIDPEGDPLTAQSIQAPSLGSLTSITTSGAFQYVAGTTPGSETLLYTIGDGTSSSDPGNVTFTVLPSSNRPPVATRDHYSVPGGTALVVAADDGLLANDIDLEGDALQVQSIQAPSGGVFNSLVTSGSFTYTPDPGFEGTERLAYTISDGAFIASDTLVVEVLPSSNRAPEPQPDWYYTPEGAPLTIDASIGLLRNDIDLDGDDVSLQSAQSPSNGVFTSLVTNGRFGYTPDAGFVGQEDLNYTVSDGAMFGSSTFHLLVGVYGDVPTGIVTPPSAVGFSLHAPVPNPFNPRTEIAFRLDRAGLVRLVIYDLRGRVVDTLVDGRRDAGEHEVVWRGEDSGGHRVASGTYVVELRQEGRRALQKMTLLK